MKKYLGDILRGIWKENPVLVLLLGTGPTLALTTSARIIRIANTFFMVLTSVPCFFQ